MKTGKSLTYLVEMSEAATGLPPGPAGPAGPADPAVAAADPGVVDPGAAPARIADGTGFSSGESIGSTVADLLPAGGPGAPRAAPARPDDRETARGPVAAPAAAPAPATETVPDTLRDGPAAAPLATLTGGRVTSQGRAPLDRPAAATAPAYDPGDPLYANGDQWHLSAIGDLERVWEEATGQGVTVGIYDAGVQYDHPDLDGNYDAALHVTVGGEIHDPYPATATDTPHGTAVAGVIAAEDNGAGGVGVAFDATIAAVSIFGAQGADINDAYYGFLEAAMQMGTFDVTNHSWGRAPEFQTFADDVTTIMAFRQAFEHGRGGLGTLNVKAAGNDYGSAQGDVRNVDRDTLTVAAYGEDGFVSPYSNGGANILVSAPSSGGGRGITTTDFTGADGYTAGDYTGSFGGTSSATPTVAGVIALMLDANPALGNRDVYEILSLSSVHVGTDIGGAPDLYEEDAWSFNGADDWNNGGRHFSNDYGFGGVDAHAAVRMAEAWAQLSPVPATSASEETLFDFSATPGVAIADGATLTRIVGAFGATLGILEYGLLTLDIAHADIGDLEIRILTEDGSTVEILDARENGLAAQGGGTASWTFGIHAVRGELSQGAGAFSIVIEDTDAADGLAGTFDAYRIQWFGRSEPAPEDDVYHYTDEVFWAIGHEGGRATLTDTAGTDTIDAAAMTGDLLLNLAASGDLRRNNTVFGSYGTNTAIENAMAGDGDDLLYGNGLGNTLWGMRGNDWMRGQGGADTLHGGAGNDWADYLASGGGVTVDLATNVNTGAQAQGDRLYGIENLRGSSNADDLTGNGLGNRLLGEAGFDVLAGLAGGDVLNGGAGSDTADYGASTAAVTVDLSGGGSAAGGHAAGDVLLSIENLVGSGFGDALTGNGTVNTLHGGGGNDVLEGGAQDDVLRGEDGNDVLEGGAGADVLGGGSGTDAASYQGSAAAVSVDLATGTGAGGDAAGDAFGNIANLIGSGFGDTLRGEAGHNALFGLGGDDFLDGREGHDRINGGDGTDTLAGRDGNDVLNGGAGGDQIVGGPGMDTASYEGSNAGVAVNLASGAGAGGWATGDALTSIENLVGSGHDDSLVGNATRNRLNGNGGDDLLFGAGGSDIFEFAGDFGADTVRDFAAGIDLLLFDVGPDYGIGDLGFLQDGADARITFVPNGSTVTVLNTLVTVFDTPGDIVMV